MASMRHAMDLQLEAMSVVKEELATLQLRGRPQTTSVAGARDPRGDGNLAPKLSTSETTEKRTGRAAGPQLRSLEFSADTVQSELHNTTYLTEYNQKYLLEKAMQDMADKGVGLTAVQDKLEAEEKEYAKQQARLRAAAEVLELEAHHAKKNHMTKRMEEKEFEERKRHQHEMERINRDVNASQTATNIGEGWTFVTQPEREQQQELRQSRYSQACPGE